MNELRDTIVKWVDQRMEDMLSAPRMWGSDEAVELQMLLLLEIRALALRPAELVADPGRILDLYTVYLSKTYPSTPNLPLSQIVEPDRLGLTLATELRKFRDEFVKQFVVAKEATRRGAISTKPPAGPWKTAYGVSQKVPTPARMGGSVMGGAQ